jgi:predicted transcriptional regulator
MFICQNPGVYHYQIVKELGHANHIINWHIQALLQFNFIKELRIDNHQLYYESNYAEDQVINEYYIRNEKSNQILEYLKKQPDGCSKTQLTKQLKMHPLTIKKYTDELVKNSFIIKKNSGPKLYFNENLNSTSLDIRLEMK